ncbi:hypothetical protein CDAR_96381 [Caerostris darwini]|uniref:Uncharacterized protein n=1 Tax=Caerostris darwini TaxID=1538125 RepID=A0AAV4TDH8_9ARAC|nr:hypothetical protein CDAR_96381 [Caerostris darwini]
MLITIHPQTHLTRPPYDYANIPSFLSMDDVPFCGTKGTEQKNLFLDLDDLISRELVERNSVDVPKRAVYGAGWIIAWV